MKKLARLLGISLISFSVNSFSEQGITMESLGVEKHTYDTIDTRTTTYTKEIGNSGAGVYGRTTNEYKNYGGERDTTSNQVQGAGSVGAGVYMEHDWGSGARKSIQK